MSSTGQSILIVDDNPANLYTLEQMLSELDVEIIKAESGNDALVATLNHELSLCILDVQMPQMDGFELAEILRQGEKTRFVPIIFLTAAMSHEMSIAKGYESGAVDYLIKPYSPLVLTSKVKAFLELNAHRLELQQQRRELEELTVKLHAEVEERQRAAEAERIKAEQLSAALAEVEKAHQELRATQAGLVQAGRMAAVGELAAGVAHEINSPLTGIVLYANRLIKRSADPRLRDLPEFAVFPENLAQIARYSEQCRQIVANLLNFGRQEQRTPELIDVGEVVEAALGMVGERLRERGIEVATELWPKRLAVRGDNTQIQQALINLMFNAAEAMADGGTLGIATTSGPGAAVSIRVSDTGQGIAEENLGKIFDPFFTTKRVGEGAGIGLSVVYYIVQQHGGTVDVNSREGHGTSVVLELPAQQ